jgi:predicted Zn-dependent protease
MMEHFWRLTRRFLRRTGRLFRHVRRMVRWVLIIFVRIPAAYIGRSFVLTWKRVVYRWKHGSFRHFLWGLPSLLMGIGVVILVLLAWAVPTNALDQAYQQDAVQSAGAHDYQNSMVCYERLTQLHPEQPEFRFQWALAAEGLGQIDQAAGLLSQLAPVDHQGYGPAHLRQAQYLMALKNAPPEILQAAEKHLLHAPNSSMTHFCLGELYMVAGRSEEAEGELLVAARDPMYPEASIMLARYYATHDKKVLARQLANDVITRLQNKAEKDLDNVTARLLWAQSLVLVEDYKGAISTLEVGLTLGPADRYRQALAEVCAWWAESLGPDLKNNPDVRFARIEKGLSYQPDNYPLLDQLFKLTKLEGKEGDQARVLLQKLLAQGKSAGVVHLLLGVKAWQEGRPEEGKFQLKQAFEQSPQMPVVVNNLAWMLAKDTPPDLERALQLIQSVIERWPNQPNFLDTRGHIYAKMNRLDEALPDLEKSIKAFPDSKATHEALAEIYEKKGVKEMAEEHRRLAGPKKP